MVPEQGTTAEDGDEQTLNEQDPAAIVGRRVRDIRTGLNLTQAELAERLGAKRPYIAGIEAGTRTPSLPYLFKIARALGVRPAQLLEDPDAKEEQTRQVLLVLEEARRESEERHQRELAGAVADFQTRTQQTLTQARREADERVKKTALLAGLGGIFGALLSTSSKDDDDGDI